MKVGIYSFGLNETHNVNDWLASCAGASHVTFCDSGSDDCTPANLRHAHAASIDDDNGFCPHGGLTIHQIGIRPWRFDTAHNTALALVPADMDICIPLHMDERLQPGWREALDAAWAEKPFHKAFYDYQFAETLTFRQNRIHSRHGYVWRFPAHEGIYRYDSESEVIVDTSLKIVQTQDRTIDRMSRDLWLLELGVLENPQNARMQFYLGRQLMYAGRYEEAVPYLRHYLTMPDRWPGEAAQCADALAICYRNGAR